MGLHFAHFGLCSYGEKYWSIFKKMLIYFLLCWVEASKINMCWWHWSIACVLPEVQWTCSNAACKGSSFDFLLDHLVEHPEAAIYLLQMNHSFGLALWRRLLPAPPNDMQLVTFPCIMLNCSCGRALPSSRCLYLKALMTNVHTMWHVVTVAPSFTMFYVFFNHFSWHFARFVWLDLPVLPCGPFGPLSGTSCCSCAVADPVGIPPIPEIEGRNGSNQPFGIFGYIRKMLGSFRIRLSGSLL